MATKMQKIEQPENEQNKLSLSTKLKKEDREKLAISAQKRVQKILTVSEKSKQMEEIKKEVNSLGDSEINSVGAKSVFLERKNKEMANNITTKDVGKAISDLSTAAEDSLKPQGVFGSFKKFLGNLPLLGKFREGQLTLGEQLETIGETLNQYVEEAKRDDAELAKERLDLYNLIKKLDVIKYENGVAIEILQEVLPELEAEDHYKAEIIKTEILLEMTKKQLMLEKHILFAQESIVSFDTLREMNKEILESLDFAKKTTLPALRNAATVAGALLGNEERIEMIHNINSTHEKIRAANSENLTKMTKQTIELADNPGSKTDDALKNIQKAMAAAQAMKVAKDQRITKFQEQIKQLEIANAQIADLTNLDTEQVADAATTLNKILEKRQQVREAIGEDSTQLDEKPENIDLPKPKKPRRAPKTSS